MAAKHPTSLLTLTILGCGTSTGVPLIGCKCAVCRSRNPKNNRTRASAWIQVAGRSIIIDTGTDFRQQALREKIPRVDAVLYTHPHTDHTHGIDELRSYNYLQQATIPLYGNAWTYQELKHRFPYIFDKPGSTPVLGGGVPKLTLHRFHSKAKVLDIQGIPVTPISVTHGVEECIGYRIDSVAYVTDCSYIPESSFKRLEGVSVLVLDCIRLQKHGTHLNFEEALEVISQVRPERTYLTHLGHDFDYAKWMRKLPRGVRLAYDGLKIRTQVELQPTGAT